MLELYCGDKEKVKKMVMLIVFGECYGQKE
uniref:Uncharacterized protein n=1 Tax=Anguilla anguilla TaxID=7936 RepID=A0A0E9QI38_ANGAN